MISDLKDFERLLKICRKQGVTDLTYEGLAVKFGELPSIGSAQESDQIPTNELTPEQLAFYSVEIKP